MVDTVTLKLFKFKNEKIYDFILDLMASRSHGWLVESKESVQITEKAFIFKSIHYDKESYVVMNGKIHFPSYGYYARFRVKEDHITIEFSLPKFLYGTNIFQLLSHSLLGIRTNPYQIFNQAVKHFFTTITLGMPVNYSSVLVTRIDFCFNQFFSSKTLAFSYISQMEKKFNHKSNTKSYSGSGVALVSKSTYMKLYHKGLEFEKHDKNKLDNFTADQVQTLQNMADKCVRFEINKNPKNWSYQFKTKFSDLELRSKYPEYRTLKKKKANKSISKIELKRLNYLRSLFETAVHFSLGSPSSYILLHQNNVEKLTETYFNHMYYSSLAIFKKHFEIKGSVSEIKIDDETNDNMFKIYAYIKKYKSLESAYNKGKIPKTTYYRYKKILAKKEVSTIDNNINYNQDFTYMTYLSLVSQSFLFPTKLSGVPFF